MVKKKSTGGDGGFRLIYADECEIHANPHLAKVWQKKGQPLRIPSAGDDHKFMVFGGVEYRSGQIAFREEERKNSAGFMEWLKDIEGAYPDELVLIVLDNVGYHKSRRCLEWFQAHQEHIRPFFLPAYAPHLNLMERLWRYLKAKLSCHRWWADQSALKKAAEEILTHMKVNFVQENGPTITLVQNICASA